jgi:hypothetical protein
MAKLSPDIRATLNQQKEQLLDLIDEAKSLEFILLDAVGENQETISTLEQLNGDSRTSQNQAFTTFNASPADCRSTTPYL